MASNLTPLDSVGGFSVENLTLINETKDLVNVNSLEIKNTNYSDMYGASYVLKGNTTDVLALDGAGTQIAVPSSSINFITAHIIGVNNLGTGHLSQKLESVVTVDSSGAPTEVSNLITIIKDSVPSGETWSVELFDTGALNRFSYSVAKSGGTPGQTIKWVGHVQVVSIDWT